MNNFTSVFEELSKLYEEPVKEVPAKDTAKDEAEIEEACDKEKLVEAADDEIEIFDDEAPVEEEHVEEVPAEDEPVEEEEIEDEPRQIIAECDKCGAIIIFDEADIVVDEESDLVNIEDECKFCEETAGYKILGVVAPYNPEEIEIVTEDLADWYRKKFDKPASLSAQQSWEDELNGECGEISDKRRKHLERKFAQQRDWEARHPEKDPMRVDELLDVKPNISLSLDGGEGNDVDVL
jgi:hypothetical protein